MTKRKIVSLWVRNIRKVLFFFNYSDILDYFVIIYIIKCIWCLIDTNNSFEIFFHNELLVSVLKSLQVVLYSWSFSIYIDCIVFCFYLRWILIKTFHIFLFLFVRHIHMVTSYLWSSVCDIRSFYCMHCLFTKKNS